MYMYICCIFSQWTPQEKGVVVRMAHNLYTMLQGNQKMLRVDNLQHMLQTLGNVSNKSMGMLMEIDITLKASAILWQ